MSGRTCVIGLVCLSFACDPPTPEVVSETDAAGTVAYAVGQDVRERSYGEVDCTPEGDVTRVELHSSRVIRGPQGRPKRPRLLVARHDGSQVVEAHAFLPQAVYDGVEHPMLHFIADDCKLEGRGERTLVCNESTVVGWLVGGERPRPSFKAKFRCP